MNYNLPVFKRIEILKVNGSYSSYSESSILITGDYLIVISKELDDSGDYNHTKHEIINLSQIKSYKTK